LFARSADPMVETVAEREELDVESPG
jgi:hypothetical protein